MRAEVKAQPSAEVKAEVGVQYFVVIGPLYMSSSELCLGSAVNSD